MPAVPARQWITRGCHPPARTTPSASPMTTLAVAAVHRRRPHSLPQHSALKEALPRQCRYTLQIPRATWAPPRRLHRNVRRHFCGGSRPASIRTWEPGQISSTKRLTRCPILHQKATPRPQLETSCPGRTLKKSTAGTVTMKPQGRSNGFLSMTVCPDADMSTYGSARLVHYAQIPHFTLMLHFSLSVPYSFRYSTSPSSSVPSVSILRPPIRLVWEIGRLQFSCRMPGNWHRDLERLAYDHPYNIIPLQYFRCSMLCIRGIFCD